MSGDANQRRREFLRAVGATSVTFGSIGIVSGDSESEDTVEITTAVGHDGKKWTEEVPRGWYEANQSARKGISELKDRYCDREWFSGIGVRSHPTKSYTVANQEFSAPQYEIHTNNSNEARGDTPDEHRGIAVAVEEKDIGEEYGELGPGDWCENNTDKWNCDSDTSPDCVRGGAPITREGEGRCGSMGCAVDHDTHGITMITAFHVATEGYDAYYGNQFIGHSIDGNSDMDYAIVDWRTNDVELSSNIRQAGTVSGQLTKSGVEYNRDLDIPMNKRGARSCTTDGTISQICELDSTAYETEDCSGGAHDFIVLEDMAGGQGDSGGPIYQDDGATVLMAAIITAGKDPDPDGETGVAGPALYQMPLTAGGGSCI